MAQSDPGQQWWDRYVVMKKIDVIYLTNQRSSGYDSVFAGNLGWCYQNHAYGFADYNRPGAGSNGAASWGCPGGIANGPQEVLTTTTIQPWPSSSNRCGPFSVSVPQISSCTLGMVGRRSSNFSPRKRQFLALRFCQQLSERLCVQKKLAGALHTDGGGCTLSRPGSQSGNLGLGGGHANDWN